MKSLFNKLSLLSIPAVLSTGCGMPPMNSTVTTVGTTANTTTTLPANCTALESPVQFVAQNTQAFNFVDNYGGSGLQFAAGQNPESGQFFGPVVVGSAAQSLWSMLGTTTPPAQTTTAQGTPIAVPSNSVSLTLQSTSQDGTLNLEGRNAGNGTYFMRGSFQMSPALILETRCRLLNNFGMAAGGANLQQQLAQCQAYNYAGNNGGRSFGSIGGLGGMNQMMPQGQMVMVNGQYVQQGQLLQQQQMLTGAAAAQGCISGISFVADSYAQSGSIQSGRVYIYMNNSPVAGVIAYLNNSMALVR